MRQISFFAVLFFFFGALNAQDQQSVNVGDELIISSPVSHNYKYIDVPRKNFIIKRGGIANLKSLEDRKTIVKEINTVGDDVVVTLVPANGGKFFNVYRELKANLNEALDNGELRKAQG
ncbi:MAG: hypothetical protein CMH48_04345 [Muricauda sp.]|nr:hypothetical protein [Allomuricauda sp.]MAU26481.1 hypothetical protein [Allomuricauda sp.]MBC30057.1 hypothetical protein [Allomuricauda sp.]|tara:strand:- start:15397 stop:15753 length:357 start_codon:yes stop_codon:yes gene_type:complete